MEAATTLIVTTKGGWEQDTWYDFAHPDYDFEVGFFYCGYTFRMYLSRKEKE